MSSRWSCAGCSSTHSWLSNVGAMRRNTARKISHRLAQLALGVTFVPTTKLID